MGEILGRPIGTTVLTLVFLAAGIAGLAAVLGVWPASPNTSPLAALFALVWSCSFLFSAFLTWRRSRFAGPAFVAAIGLLLFPARYIVPGGQIFLPSLVAIATAALLGYLYLRQARTAG